MNVHELAGPPDPPLAAALAAFERQFRYPLGPTGRSPSTTATTTPGSSGPWATPA